MQRLFPIPPPPYQGTIHYRDQTGKDCEITAAKFTQLTKAAYCTQPFMTERYAELKLRAREPRLPPDVALHGAPSDAKLRLIHATGENAFIGLSVVADCDIKKGERVVTYAGLLETDEEKSGNQVYSWNDNNALHYRSLAACVNHSFPNVGAYAYVADSMVMTIFYAYEDIRKGDEICVDYGRKKECLGQHAELRYEALKSFAQHHQDDMPTELWFRGDSSVLDRWYYIAENPSTLFLLYLDGVLTRAQVSHLLTMLNDENYFYTHPSNQLQDCNYLRYDCMVMDSIHKLEPLLPRLRNENPALLAEIRNYFHTTSRDCSALGALFAFTKLEFNATLTATNINELTPFAAAGIKIFDEKIDNSNTFKLLLQTYLPRFFHPLPKITTYVTGKGNSPSI